MKLLMLGDVVGSPGRRILRENLPRIRRELGVEAVVVNAENAAAGSGLTVPLAEEIFACPNSFGGYQKIDTATFFA